MDPRGKLFVLSNSEARFSSVNTFHSANQNFDSTLYALHPMVLLAEKENNESYTFGQMLKQPDAADFIHAMIK